MKVRFSINLKIALVIFLALLAQGSVLFWINANSIQQGLLQTTRNEAQLSATSLQHTLGYLAQTNAIQQLQETVTALGSNTNIKSAYLIDEHNKVIAATRIVDIAEDIDTLLHTDSELPLKHRLPQMRDTMKAAMWQSFDNQTLYSAAPIILGSSSPNNLRPDRVGILIKQIDLGWITRQKHNTLISETIPMVLIITLFTLLIFIFIRILVTQRIQALHDFASQFYLGKSFTPIAEHGSDELSSLVTTLNGMVVQLNHQHQELKNSEQFLNHSQEMAHLGSWDLDIVNNQLNWSNEVYRIFGLTPKEFPANYEAFLDGIHPDDRDKVNNAYSSSLREGRDSYEVEHRVVQKTTGQIRYVREKCTHIKDAAGNVIRSIGMIHDITEQKNTDLRLQEQQNENQQILDSMVDGIISIDERGNILTFNPAAEKMFGYQNAEVLGHNISMLMDERVAVEHDKYLDNHLRTGENKLIGFGREVMGKRKNNQTFPMRLSVAHLPDDAEGRRRFIGSCHDTSVEKQQEEKLQHSLKMDALGKLTGGIAHDFNNMLGVILGFSEMLKPLMKEGSKELHYANQITQASERASKLTSKLLAFSRQTDSDVHTVNMNTQLEHSRDMMAKTLTPRITINYDLDSTLGYVKLDPASLDDAVLNMSINAMHAMPSGGSLTFKTWNLTASSNTSSAVKLADGEYVCLSITDTGTGMDKETKRKAFDPFFSTKGDSGTGLGLSQVYGFVQQSGGNIQLDSEPGKGTTITMFFPRTQSPGKSIYNAEKERNSEQQKGYECILVVDDEPALLELASEILSAEGYRVLTAVSGEDAISVLENERIDMLVTDIIMPDLDGYQLAEYVRNNDPKVKIIFVTGYDDKRQSESFKPDQHQQRMLKPYEPTLLLKKVRNLLDRVS